MLTEHKCNLLAVVHNRSISTFPSLPKIHRCNRYPNNKFNSQIHTPNTRILRNSKIMMIVRSPEQVHTILQGNLKPSSYQTKMMRTIIVMTSTRMNSKRSKILIRRKTMRTAKTTTLNSTKRSNKMASRMWLTTTRSIWALPIKQKRVIWELTILFLKIVWPSLRSILLIRLYSSNNRSKTSMALTHRSTKHSTPHPLNKWSSLRPTDTVSRRPTSKREWAPHFLLSYTRWSRRRFRLRQTPQNSINKSKKFAAETRIWSSFAKS